MKRTLFAAFSLVAACLFISGSLWAETVKGKVGKVDAAGKNISVSKTNAGTGASETVVIAVKDNTGYKGVTALREVKEGSTVTIEAEKDEAGNGWVAKTVEIVQE